MKRGLSSASVKTNNFESSLIRISSLLKPRQQPREVPKREEKKQINPVVSKLTFIVLIILIFLSLTISMKPSTISITTYSVLDSVNPGANLIIFFLLLALIFFLTYESKKLK